jgi:hypothetical protein
MHGPSTRFTSPSGFVVSTPNLPPRKQDFMKTLPNAGRWKLQSRMSTNVPSKLGTVSSITVERSKVKSPISSTRSRSLE